MSCNEVVIFSSSLTVYSDLTFVSMIVLIFYLKFCPHLGQCHLKVTINLSIKPVNEVPIANSANSVSVRKKAC